MRRIPQSICLYAGLILAPLFTQAQQLGKLELSQLDRYIEQSRKAWKIPGLSIAIVKDSKIAFAKGYGVLKSGQDAPVDENTLFSLASNTKPFTVSALAILEDQGRIDWDDRVRQYLPGFKLYDPYVSNEIRIRDLLCHRSGLKTFSGDLLWYGSGYSRKEIIYRARYLKPVHGFRYHYGYSNIMYLVAGQIFPVVTGKSWDEFVRNELIGPLGMDHTYVSLEEIRGETNLAHPHHVDLLKGTSEVIPFMAWDNIAPAGSITSSASDMSRWLLFHLNKGNWKGRQLISRKNLWEMQAMHTVMEVERHSSRIWKSRHFEGYGLGWQLCDYRGCKVVSHGGGSDGMISELVMVPEEQLGFVIMTNCINAVPVSLKFYILDSYFTGKSYDWCNLFLQNSLQGLKRERERWETYKNSANPDLKPSQEINNYCGVYGGALYGNVEVRMEQDRLLLDFLPAPGLEGDLTPLERDTFLIRLRNHPALPEGTVKFYLDGSGRVGEIVVDIPNPDFDFTELELKRLYDLKLNNECH